MELAKRVLNKAIWFLIAAALVVPAYIDSDFFFPYIFSKTLAFRIIVEVLLLLWLAYVYIKKKKIKIDWLTVVFFTMLVFMYISSIFGENFYVSFWSTVERGEGLLLWTHLFFYFFIIRNFITSKKQWLGVFDVFFATAQIVAIIGFLQYLGVDFINRSGGVDERISSTIGNAAYLAGYLLFAFFIGAYLMFKRKNIWLNPYYIIAALIDIFIVIQTGTRGAFLAFIISVLLFFVYNVFKLANNKIKYYVIALGLVFALFIGFIFINKDSSFVQNNLPLRRITSISLEERTAQTRLMAWDSAWRGFKDRPILGHGQEHYLVVFNKYFNPEIYSHAGSRIWFDRAHNIFLDHLTTGGLVGFVLYSIFIIAPAWIILKKKIFKENGFWKTLKHLFVKNPDSEEDEDIWESFAEQVLFLAIFSFILQGMLVFEALVTYIPLLLIIAYVATKYIEPKFVWDNFKKMLIAFVIYAALFVPIMYVVNIKEAKANLDVISALRLQSVDYNGAIEIYNEVLDYRTSGTNEYLRRMAEYVDGLIVNRNVTPYEATKFVEIVDRELEARAEAFPADVQNYLLFMRHYNYTYVIDPDRLYKVGPLGEKALEHSPTRPQIYYELGYADLYLYQRMIEENRQEEAVKYQKSTVDNFQKAIDLNNDVMESYVNMVMVLLTSDQSEKVQSYVDIMEAMEINYKKEAPLDRMTNSALHAESYEWAAYFSELLIAVAPQNPDYHINAALSHAYLEDFDRAIEIATGIKEFGGQYIIQSEEFIRDIEAGNFQK
ncbi:O-antigen ligase family protein [Candidatus Parcubacteria bacterium]|jgi:O-antigen ligase|nr:O-antigen ligase family protein [Candidatus Parcubacteria bacterium]MBT7228446.1 O-antigen ligase family protein [Candidatus Parcubacteria bacterium]